MIKFNLLLEIIKDREKKTRYYVHPRKNEGLRNEGASTLNFI